MDHWRQVFLATLITVVVGLGLAACGPAGAASGTANGSAKAGVIVPALGTPPPGTVTAPALALLPTTLSLDATGLGPCEEPWWTTCNYGIRVEGPGGYDHRGNFAWDEGPRPSGGYEHGPAGPVASTGIWGDVPTALPAGVWTISFRLWHGSDIATYVPVPGGTPRLADEEPFSAACSQQIDTGNVAGAALHVAFNASACTVTAALTPRSPASQSSPAAPSLALNATGLSPCDVTFPYTCQYLIRLDGPRGYEHYGWFTWDPATQETAASTGVGGDLPGSLNPGDWTFSFDFVHRGDLVSYIPVAGGAPRTEGIDAREVGCTQRLHVTDELSDRIEVAFTGDRCKVTVETAMP